MEDFLEKLAAQNNLEDSDYTEGGLLMCGRCHTPKQARIPWPIQEDSEPHAKLVPILCRCGKEAQQQEVEQSLLMEFNARMDELWADGITEKTYFRHHFSEDDRHNQEVSDVCKRYVDRWDDMRTNNIGLLFYGPVGTGKSFFACCIANAMLERRVEVAVTSFPRLLNLLQEAKSRQKLLDRLSIYRLLVIDDLGVERDSSYAMEQVYNVIDARSRSGLPLIITTNLSLQDLKNPPTMQHGRIYDRVLELCPVQILLTGDSLRVKNAEVRQKKARNLLLDERA